MFDLSKYKWKAEKMFKFSLINYLIYMATQLKDALTEAEIKKARLEDKLDDPLDYLSFNYQVYCNNIYSISITEPSKYYMLRNNLSLALNTNILQGIYSTIFHLLRYGQIGTNMYTEGHKPGYPCEKVNKICMDISVLIKQELDKITALLLPPDNNNLANSSLSKHLASLIDIPAGVAVSVT